MHRCPFFHIKIIETRKEKFRLVHLDGSRIRHVIKSLDIQYIYIYRYTNKKRGMWPSCVERYTPKPVSQ
jgi:transposase